MWGCKKNLWSMVYPRVSPLSQQAVLAVSEVDIVIYQ
jgi:hypothetical protein